MHGTERCHQLSGEDPEMTGPRGRVLDDERPTGKPGVGPDRLFGRKRRSVEHLIPDRQCEAKVDILWLFALGWGVGSRAA